MANEKRLIDANEVERKIRICISSWSRDCNSNAPIIINGLKSALERVVYAPTVDAVEVVHGRWELHGNDDDCGCSYFCSNCHDSYDEEWFYVHGQYRHWNYCPNCGAKMDGDGNG